MSTEIPVTVTILLKEYDSLRSEISERMKTSFSHLGYIGAIVIFGFPFTKGITCYHMIAAIFGLAVLLWITVVNWFWLRRCAEQIREIEQRIDEELSTQGLLTWERKANKMSTWVLNLPRSFITRDKLIEVPKDKKEKN
jgi:hypothetical protein